MLRRGSVSISVLISGLFEGLVPAPIEMHKTHMYRDNRLPQKLQRLADRTNFIIKSFVILLRHAYLNKGVIEALKNVLVTMAHLDIVLMMTRPDKKVLLTYHPDLLNGSISHPYLSTLFNSSRTKRCAIMISHYAYVAARLKDDFYDQVADGGIMLWKSVAEGTILRICIEFAKQHRHEGDLILKFEMNYDSLYVLSFSIVPGYLVDTPAPQVILIGRVQGTKERFEEIRRATKLCKDISPAYLLVTAAQAIASELDISFLAGVNSREHLSDAVQHSFDYDAFWRTFAEIKTKHNFSVFAASFTGKPFKQISAGHRRRTRLKRHFKSEINDCVRAAFAEKCLKVYDLRKKAAH